VLGVGQGTEPDFPTFLAGLEPRVQNATRAAKAQDKKAKARRESRRLAGIPVLSPVNTVTSAVLYYP